MTAGKKTPPFFSHDERERERERSTRVNQPHEMCTEYFAKGHLSRLDTCEYWPNKHWVQRQVIVEHRFWNILILELLNNKSYRFSSTNLQSSSFRARSLLCHLFPKMERQNINTTGMTGKPLCFFDCYRCSLILSLHPLCLRRPSVKSHLPPTQWC